MTTQGFAGPAGTIPGGNFGYQFAGPTVQLTVQSGQRITAAAQAQLGNTTTLREGFEYGLCDQPQGGGSILNFVGANYTWGELDGDRLSSFPASATRVFTAGTWIIGYCVKTTIDLNNNDYVNGWAMITS